MEPIAVLNVSQSRRIFGTFAQLGVGVMMLFVAAKYPPQNPVALVFLIAFGGFMLWQARNLYRSAGRHLVLTRETVEDSSGVVLCRLDEISSVERGPFALKPSNGFALVLKKSQPKAWCPGLWWRLGRRVGVGGTTAGRSTREMADMIAVMLTDRGPELLAAIDEVVAEVEADKGPNQE